MKPMFTVHAGEFLVGDYINQKLGKKYEVWVPTKDRGTDLLVTHKKGKHSPVKLQVKFSRGYTPNTVPPEETLALGWFTLDPMKIRASTADLWVFVILTLRHTPHFVIIPTTELARRIPRKTGRMWSMYMIALRNRKCYDFRGLPKAEQKMLLINGVQKASRDYSKYLENWKLLGKVAQ